MGNITAGDNTTYYSHSYNYAIQVNQTDQTNHGNHISHQQTIMIPMTYAADRAIRKLSSSIAIICSYAITDNSSCFHTYVHIYNHFYSGVSE